MRTLAEMKGFGPVRLKALAARGIETALDLVETLPTGYKDTTHPLSPVQMTEGRQRNNRRRIRRGALHVVQPAMDEG